jgi:hypothetical protein
MTSLMNGFFMGPTLAFMRPIERWLVPTPVRILQARVLVALGSDLSTKPLDCET